MLLGLEIGGTKLQLGLGPGDGRLLACTRLAVRPHAGAEGIRAQILEAVDPLLASRAARRSDLRAVGVGFGGPVDADRGVVWKSHQVLGWDEFPLADWLRETLGVADVAVRNDADAAALAEARFGAGVGMSPLLYVTIGSGVGGGLVVDGAIYRGGGSRGAMEIGHLLIHDAHDYGKEKPIRLEQLASGWAITAQARRWLERSGKGREDRPLYQLTGGDPSKATAELVARAAAANDVESVAILEIATRAVAVALGHAVALLAPRRIVLGGGVSLIGEEFWFAPIRRKLERRTFAPYRGTFDLVPAALGEEVVVHGALALARDGGPDPAAPSAAPPW